jgi:hypothetical protein
MLAPIVFVLGLALWFRRGRRFWLLLSTIWLLGFMGFVCLPLTYTPWMVGGQRAPGHVSGAYMLSLLILLVFSPVIVIKMIPFYLFHPSLRPTLAACNRRRDRWRW